MKVACAFLLLAGCASRQAVLKPVTVEIPIAVPCAVETVAKPDFALTHVTLSASLAEKTRAALVELLQRRAYEAELEAQIDACR